MEVLAAAVERKWGRRRAAANLKGGPRASWGSVPWRRDAILGEKGGVRCAEEGDDLQVGQGSQRLKAGDALAS